MKRDPTLINADAAILSVAQLIQPCNEDGLAAQARATLKELGLDKRQVVGRIKNLLSGGYLWARSDALLLLTPKGDDIAKASLSPKQRDKFRLLLLNKERYK